MELFKSMPSSVCLLMAIPLVLMTAPTVYGSHDFPVFRMQQYDLNGVKYGSRGAAINLEARSLSSENLIRKCAVVRALELSIDHLNKAVSCFCFEKLLSTTQIFWLIEFIRMHDSIFAYCCNTGVKTQTNCLGA